MRMMRWRGLISEEGMSGEEEGVDVGECEAPWFEDSAGRVQMVADDNEVCVRVRPPPLSYVCAALPLPPPLPPHLLPLCLQTHAQDRNWRFHRGAGGASCSFFLPHSQMCLRWRGI